LKVFHTIRIPHRDEVEAPLTDWLREARTVDVLAAQSINLTAAITSDILREQLWQPVSKPLFLTRQEFLDADIAEVMSALEQPATPTRIGRSQSTPNTAAKSKRRAGPSGH
jgi:hypothetical protein